MPSAKFVLFSSSLHTVWSSGMQSDLKDEIVHQQLQVAYYFPGFPPVFIDRARNGSMDHGPQIGSPWRSMPARQQTRPIEIGRLGLGGPCHAPVTELPCGSFFNYTTQFRLWLCSASHQQQNQNRPASFVLFTHIEYYWISWNQPAYKPTKQMDL